MSPFTDEDLKQFKEDMDAGEDVFFDLPSLIARLEAAEKICEQDARHAPNDPDVIAWRKAAGK